MRLQSLLLLLALLLLQPRRGSKGAWLSLRLGWQLGIIAGLRLLPLSLAVAIPGLPLTPLGLHPILKGGRRIAWQPRGAMHEGPWKVGDELLVEVRRMPRLLLAWKPLLDWKGHRYWRGPRGWARVVGGFLLCWAHI